MRDTLKDKKYFQSLIDNRYKSLEKRFNKLKEGMIAPDRLIPVKEAMYRTYLEIVFAKYSVSVNQIREDVIAGIKLLNESLINNNGKVYIKDHEYADQYYVQTYQEVLRYLCLGYLLNITDKDFQVLVDVIDRDNISDNLYEFIIKARFPNRKQKRPEDYDADKSVILNMYHKLRNAIKQGDKEKSAFLVEKFLNKDFYHKHMNLYNSHKSKANIYCGYWSFESAAIVKIMELDDSSFIDNKYYPKDLIHQYIESPKKKGLFGKLGL